MKRLLDGFYELPNKLYQTPGDAAPTGGGGGASPATPPAPAAPPATPPEAPPAAPAAPAAPAGKTFEQVFGQGVTPEQVLSFIQQQNAKLVAAAQPVTAPVAQPATPAIKDLIFEDPEQALDRHLANRMGPILQEFYDHSTSVTRQLVKGRQRVDKGADGRESVTLAMPHFDRFEREINDFVGRVDVRLRNRPETWESAYNFVIGQHHSELVAEEIQARVPAVEAGGGGPGAPAPKVKLTDEQRHVARGMGMTDEEYAAEIEGGA